MNEPKTVRDVRLAEEIVWKAIKEMETKDVEAMTALTVVGESMLRTALMLDQRGRLASCLIECLSDSLRRRRAEDESAHKC
jgi:hypothetical protein